jgi:hypothetical protein
MSTVMSPASRARLLKDTLGRALRNPPPTGTRAFTLDGLSCTVDWRLAASTGLHQVRICVRRGERRLDHATSLADLAMLPRTCEQVLLQFEVRG